MEKLAYLDRDFTFGQTFLSLRSRIGLSQQELAATLGVTRQTIGTWEGGIKYPNANHLQDVITLAVSQQVFNAENIVAEIKTLWKSARQKILLDETWLALLLRQQASSEEPGVLPETTETRAVGETSGKESGNQFNNRPNRRLNLPVQLTSFIGRTAEKNYLANLLAEPGCRLVTVLGPGGIGKTRLALEVGHEQIPNFPDGIVFVPLASLNSTNQMIPTIFEALNLAEGENLCSGSPMSCLLRYLGGRRILLILDNLEHLLDEVEVLNEILCGAPNVTILVTSRERLNLQTEWIFDLKGLTYPVAKDLETVTPQDLTKLSQCDYSAVQLFTQRALQVRPGLILNPEITNLIGHICQQVAGIPLAIELAAANVRTYTVSEVDRQISSGLDALSSDLRDIPVRHRSLQVVFERSWSLLTDAEKTLFSRLAIFRGGCNLEAAEQIIGASLPHLAKLVDKSLLRELEAPTSSTQEISLPATVISHRFYLLEPLREFALEKLRESGEEQRLGLTHADFFLAFVESVVDLWDTPHSNSAIAQLDQDYDNVRAILSWVCKGGDPATGLRMGIALRKFWQRRGLFAEGRRWLENLLKLESDELPGTTLGLRARALYTAAWLATDQHDYGRATELFDQSRQLRKTGGFITAETGLLAPEARQARAIGNYPRSKVLREETVTHYRVSGDRGSFSSGGLGLALYELALTLRELGEFTQAQALFEECLQLHEELGEREGIGIGLLGLSDLARDLADAPAVRQYCEPSLFTCRELGMKWPSGFLLNNLALAAYLEADLNQAASFINQSTDLFREIQAPAGLAEVLITRGHILRAQGEVMEAYTDFNTALQHSRTAGPRLMLVTALEGMAGLLAQVGALEIAVQLQTVAARMRMQMGTIRRPLDLILQTGELANASQLLGAARYTKIVEDGQNLSLDKLMVTIGSVENLYVKKVWPLELSVSKLD